MKQSGTPFRLMSPLRRAPIVGPAILGLAERALAFERLGNIHRQLTSTRNQSAASFAARALELLQVHFEFDPAELARIPAQGPAIVVANHPYGGLEGLFLIQLLLSHRKDTLVIANELLTRLPEIADAIIPVNAFGGRRAAHTNASALRRALKHVRGGGLLALFPAGEVSHLHLSAGRVCDPPWSTSAVRLVRKCGCAVTPIHFGGGNSAVFQTLGLLHPRLRTALLTRELLNKGRRTIPVTIGRPLPPERIADQAGDSALASYLRLSTYALEARRVARSRVRRRESPVDEPVAKRLIEAEIECLRRSQTLAAGGETVVLFARANQIPWALREIGRLRELSFRAVGEGTGLGSDIDAYDVHYVHLIAWNGVTGEIAGAYRLGHVDEIVRRLGRSGLYTQSLFSYGEAFLRSLDGPALELGRSFVAQRYQRDMSTLLLLWKGIAAYVARHPRYHVLYGPVSISSDYAPHSRALLIDFLTRRCYDRGLAQLIRPRRPFRRTHSLAALSGDLARLEDLEELTKLLADMEPDGKGVPVLLKHYLRLGARLVGFNVDADFNDAVDGMVVVDLLRTEPRLLQKYMGREQTTAFLTHPR